MSSAISKIHTPFGKGRSGVQPRQIVDLEAFRGVGYVSSDALPDDHSDTANIPAGSPDYCPDQ